MEKNFLFVITLLIGFVRSQRIAFGSCNKHNVDTRVWNAIAARKPRAFIFGGDTVYGDEMSPTGFKGANLTRLKDIYGQQWEVQDFKQLVDEMNASAPVDLSGKPVFPLLGTIDDHEYGINDGDRTYPDKKKTKELFLDFFKVPKDSPRWNRPGVYDEVTLDFSTHDRSAKISIILLDLRYNRDPYSHPKGDFLGVDQWKWLDKTLKKSKADAHVFISSLQVLPEKRMPYIQLGEWWNRLPESRKRLLDLVERHNVKGPLLLSGDVHYAEISEASCGNKKMVEITSSGLTHSWGDFTFMTFLLTTYMTMMPQKYQTFKRLQRNFGELEFQWEDEPTVTARLFTDTGEMMTEKTWGLNSLTIANTISLFDKTRNDPVPSCSPIHGTLDDSRIQVGYICIVVSWGMALLFVARLWMKALRRLASVVLPQKAKLKSS
eukprot:m.86637 g.86637  ORF g.86637 m.86637 type:complete len:434 (-) comp13062_c0_seq5:269-1570(-)